MDISEAEDLGRSAPEYVDVLATEVSETSESRHFNAWLDRALPILQEQLASLGIFNITPSKANPKH